MARKILSILLVIIMLFACVGCNNDNNNTKTTDETHNIESTQKSENSEPNDDENDNEDENEFNKETHFGMLSFSVHEVNEGYLLEARSGENKWNGSFDRDKIDGEFVTLQSTGADFHYMYNSSYDLKFGLPMDFILSVKPQAPLTEVNDPMYDYDTSLNNVREFNVNYYDFILEAGSNQFDEIVFDYKHNMEIKGNVGCFKFFHYSFDDFRKEGCYVGNYYQVMVYAVTMEKANIHFNFNEETQTFTIESDSEISNIYIEVTTKDNDSVETVCTEEIKGNTLTFTINEDCTANVQIK